MTMTASVTRAFLFTLLLVGLAPAASPARAQIGFAGGYALNMTNQPGFSSTAQNTFDAKGSFNVGMFYDFRFGRVTLRPGVFIRQANFDWELDNVNFSPLQSSIRVAEFPLDVLVHFRTGSINPYVVVGPSFSFLHTDQPDLRQTLDRSKGSTNYPSITLGGGIEFEPGGWGILLFPEIRYSFALSGFLQEEYIVRTVSFAADSAQRLNSLTLRLGISLPSFE